MKKIIFVLVLTILILSCAQINGDKGTITEEQVENYIAAYKRIRKAAPQILEEINADNNFSKSGKPGFKEIKKIISDSGLKTYAEFVRLNAKIGAIFSILQASKGLETQHKLQESGQEMFRDSKQFIEDQLNDPEIPKETKSELRKTLAEIDKNSKRTER